MVYYLISCKKIAFYAATEWWVSTLFVVGRRVVSSPLKEGKYSVHASVN
jgi:hypothetical protein